MSSQTVNGDKLREGRLSCATNGLLGHLQDRSTGGASALISTCERSRT